jgi:two-component sensor histidine kinase
MPSRLERLKILVPTGFVKRDRLTSRAVPKKADFRLPRRQGNSQSKPPHPIIPGTAAGNKNTVNAVGLRIIGGSWLGRNNRRAALLVLLKEVYHRVKNNLQIVSSLINLQAQNVKNKAAVELLKQSADRIKSMALLHEKLYQSKDLAKIDFNDYIHTLAGHLMFGYGAHSSRIKINLQIDAIFLDVDTAIPCGLIINELLSNALKHAFPEGRSGEIGIAFTQNGDEFMLVITDNGIGFPAGLDFKRSASLGLQLVSSLTNQLLGQLTLDQGNGSTFTLRFTHPS